MPGNSSNSCVTSSILNWAPPSWVTTLDFESTFDQAKSQALDAIHHWYPQRQSQDLDLSRVEACVAIKNHERAIVHDNPAYQLFFARVAPVIGKPADAHSLYRTSKLAQNTDELIAEGIRSLDCEHEGKDASGLTYNFRTFKCQLGALRDPNYFIFSMTRPMACLGNSESQCDKSLMELLDIFQSLDAIDQRTCRMDAKGETTKDIAAAINMSPRAIEIRRKKMFELFGVGRPMELVRITIRLEEHGLLPD
jgi:hypothetical protein